MAVALRSSVASWTRSARVFSSATRSSLVERGEPAQAEAVLEGLGPDGAARTHTAAVLRLARGRLRLAQGRAGAALADTRAAGEIALATGSTCPGYLAWRSAAALAQLALGDREAALSAAREEVALARSFGGQRTLGVALRAAGVAAGAPAGEQLLHESVACLERSGVALERARALTELGALLRGAGRPVEARTLLREALHIAHHAGATPLAARAESELLAAGARPRRAVLTGVEALTASERRVAELAAEGLTNREIAQALFLTENTIQTHLKSVFRKLAIRSRSQLTRALQISPGISPTRRERAPQPRRLEHQRDQTQRSPIAAERCDQTIGPRTLLAHLATEG